MLPLTDFEKNLWLVNSVTCSCAIRKCSLFSWDM